MWLLMFATMVTHMIIVHVVPKWIDLDIGHTLVTNIGSKWIVKLTCSLGLCNLTWLGIQFKRSS
jgi:hypothetical protein